MWCVWYMMVVHHVVRKAPHLHVPYYKTHCMYHTYHICTLPCHTRASHVPHVPHTRLTCTTYAPHHIGTACTTHTPCMYHSYTHARTRTHAHTAGATPHMHHTRTIRPSICRCHTTHAPHTHHTPVHLQVPHTRTHAHTAGATLTHAPYTHHTPVHLQVPHHALYALPSPCRCCCRAPPWWRSQT